MQRLSEANIDTTDTDNFTQLEMQTDTHTPKHAHSGAQEELGAAAAALATDPPVYDTARRIHHKSSTAIVQE